MNIPKKLWHIWIGPKSAPLKWMNTWPKKHPDWEYQIIDNEYISKRKFYNQHLIEKYLTMPEKNGYAGAADLIRYEILYENGGLMPGSDSICLENTEELWVESTDFCYTVYENEKLRPGFVSPIQASNSKDKFLEFIIEDLHKLTPDRLEEKEVYQITGNRYLKDIISRTNFYIKIFPSHYFIPKHFSSQHTERYNGPDKIYADQLWGSTKNIYDQGIL
jgi:mannosyltransferase OCH1-like enzyme